MKLRRRRSERSDNVIDRRGAKGGGRGLAIGAGGGIGTLVVLAIVLFGGALFGGSGSGGIDLGGALEGLGQPVNQPDEAPIPPEADPDADLVAFISFVLDDVQELWQREFARNNLEYEDAELVLFDSATQSGCGQASAATGPFYCSLDQRAYLDLGFFEELAQRFDAPGDFAQAYVLAHEIAHHVQQLTGISASVREESQRDPDIANELSIRQELQADCLAGVWGSTARDRGLLEPGDLQEGLDAAAAVGDDRIQRQATGRVDQETWTHGSSAQRVEWFTRGFESGDPGQCDTFAADL